MTPEHLYEEIKTLLEGLPYYYISVSVNQRKHGNFDPTIYYSAGFQFGDVNNDPLVYTDCCGYERHEQCIYAASEWIKKHRAEILMYFKTPKTI